MLPLHLRCKADGNALRHDTGLDDIKVRVGVRFRSGLGRYHKLVITAYGTFRKTRIMVRVRVGLERKDCA